MDYITVGEVLKAQGIKGEIKVKSLTDDSNRFLKLKVIYIDNNPFKILSRRIAGEFVYLLLENIDTRDKAQDLSGKFLSINRINSIPLQDNQYLIADLVDCLIITEENIDLGKIKYIDSYGAADVITAIGLNNKEFRFPFLNKIVASVDLQKKQFKVYKNLLDEVCVYED